MHIPDNFLSTPVWAALDAIAVPAVGFTVRRASRELEDRRIPLLGVMGAFVFAAQMINFPVGLGTSAHLVGGALLAYTLGAAPAALVMTAIIAIQAFVFQDGGVLALGANVFNMAIAGVLAAYLPFQLWATKRHRIAIFAGAFLSVMVSASLALGELLISGLAIPRAAVLMTLAVFSVNALIEGAITVSVVQALEKLNPGFVEKSQASNRRALLTLSAVALSMGLFLFFFASAAPDGIEQLGITLGIGRERLGQNQFLGAVLPPGWGLRAAAALVGLLLVFGLCLAAGRMIVRRRSA
jgi:cobalt/nickel transport system permease protein